MKQRPARGHPRIFPTRLLLLVTVVSATIAVACTLPLDEPKPVPVRITNVEIAPNPQMVTAAKVHITCSGSVTAAQVMYVAAGIDHGRTPRAGAASCPIDVDVLGMLAETVYRMEIRVWGQQGDSAVAIGPNFATGSLPADLPSLTVSSQQTSSDALTAVNVLDPSQILTHGVAFLLDGAGRVRWYVRSNRLIGDFQPQSANHYTSAVTAYEPLAFAALGYTTAEYQELDPAGDLVRKWTITGGYPTDGHEIRLTPRGTAVLFGFDFRIVDLTGLGGSNNAQIIGNVLQEVDSTGRVLFQWNAFDHFAITDIDPAISLTTQRIDWNHGNAIELDPDGNYLLSFRHFSEVTKIDGRTGTVLWRLGGVQNEFHFDPDSMRFSFQHGIRRLPDGNLILFDNGNGRVPPYSRVVEYRLDEGTKTATVAWSYRPSSDLYSFALGFAQRLSNGNTLVTFGTLGTVQEVAPSHEVVWQLNLPQGLWIYRAYRVQSVYDLSVP